MSEIKEIKNDLYHAAVVGGLSIGYSKLLKSLFGMTPPNMSKLDMSDSVKMVGIVALSMFSRDFLVKQGIIPADI
jgi:energy-converting hydrogenase Eha subunit G